MLCWWTNLCACVDDDVIPVSTRGEAYVVQHGQLAAVTLEGIKHTTAGVDARHTVLQHKQQQQQQQQQQQSDVRPEMASTGGKVTREQDLTLTVCKTVPQSQARMWFVPAAKLQHEPRLI
jgi:hypothetical protein